MQVRSIIMNDLSLQVESLSASYSGIPVIRDVSFDVHAGEIVTILGSNGAGKTTSLKVISGLMVPLSGSIRFGGIDISGLPSHVVRKMGIVLVPEGRKLFSTMSVIENLEIGAYVKEARRSKSQTLEYVYEVFPRLKGRHSQIAETLSGGEQQMLAVARALMARPKMLMLDEPSLGLAPLVVESIFEVISKIRSEGVTILLVEQNAKAALGIADRGYVIETGIITISGLAKDLVKDEKVKKAYIGL